MTLVPGLRGLTPSKVKRAALRQWRRYSEIRPEILRWIRRGAAEQHLRPLGRLLAGAGAGSGGRPPLFDRAWYVERYPPAAERRTDPYIYFLKQGLREGHDPNPLFDTAWYSRQLPAQVDARLGPFLHYLAVGAAEGRDPHPLFDTSWYLERHPDVDLASVNPLAHFLHAGRTQMRYPHPLFDTEWYVKRYPRVRAAKLNPLVHFVTAGAAEGLSPHPLFDTKWYLERYPEVDVGRTNPLVHFIEEGAAKGYDPGPFFSTQWYLERYPDVRESGLNPLVHYVAIGGPEKRDPGPRFSSDWFLDRYPGVQKSVLPPWRNFFIYGWKEGRSSRGGDYQDWVEAFDTLDEGDLTVLRRRAEKLQARPTITLIVDAAGASPALLAATTVSLEAQVYPEWEVLVVGDPALSGQIGRTEPEGPGGRLKVVASHGDESLAARVNRAIDGAAGDFLAVIAAGDRLPPHALFWIAHAIAENPGAAIVFSDQDEMDDGGARKNPFFKFAYNPALMLSNNMLENLTVYGKDLVRRVGGLRDGFEQADLYDLALRCASAAGADEIVHVPRVLHHARAASGEAGAEAAREAKKRESGLRVIADHIDRSGMKASVAPLGAHFFQVSPDPNGPKPRVSILMPSACKLEVIEPNLRKLLAHTSYPDYEVIPIVSDVRYKTPDQARFLEEIAAHPRVRLCVYEDRPFNFSWINNRGERTATGSVLCLMNDDVEITQKDWLDKLVARLELEKVAAAGPLMYYPNDTIQHAGVIVGLGDAAGHPFLGFPRACTGFAGRACLEQDLSCVTAACMVLRRPVFHEIGGFDEVLAVAYNDVDLCLKMRKHGHRIIFTPEVVMYHQESISIGNHASPERMEEYMKEKAYFGSKWEGALNDPFYSPNLVKTTEYGLAFPPRRPDFQPPPRQH